MQHKVVSPSPLLSAVSTNEDCTHLVKLGGHVEVEDLGLASDLNGDEGVDLEVGKVKVDVNRVQPDEEVDQRLLDLSAVNVLKKARLDRLTVGELAADGDEKLNRLGVDITDFNSSLVGEEHDVAFSDRVDADVELRVGGVGKEWLDDEVSEGAGGLLDLVERNVGESTSRPWQSRERKVPT
jgi:hypothetical protein